MGSKHDFALQNPDPVAKNNKGSGKVAYIEYSFAEFIFSNKREVDWALLITNWSVDTVSEGR